jgi:hypothetical protein
MRLAGFMPALRKPAAQQRAYTSMERAAFEAQRTARRRAGDGFEADHPWMTYAPGARWGYNPQ